MFSRVLSIFTNEAQKFNLRHDLLSQAENTKWKKLMNKMAEAFLVSIDKKVNGRMIEEHLIAIQKDKNRKLSFRKRAVIELAKQSPDGSFTKWLDDDMLRFLAEYILLDTSPNYNALIHLLKNLNEDDYLALRVVSKIHPEAFFAGYDPFILGKQALGLGTQLYAFLTDINIATRWKIASLKDFRNKYYVYASYILTLALEERKGSIKIPKEIFVSEIPHFTSYGTLSVEINAILSLLAILRDKEFTKEQVKIIYFMLNNTMILPSGKFMDKGLFSIAMEIYGNVKNNFTINNRKRFLDLIEKHMCHHNPIEPINKERESLKTETISTLNEVKASLV